MAFVMPFNDTFDVGVDTRSSVKGQDYQVPFRFTGKNAKLTITLQPEQLTSADHTAVHAALAKAKD